MQQMQIDTEEKARYYESIIERTNFENDALRRELRKLSDQLAQRAVLYAAQERRMMDSLSIKQYEYTGKEKSLIELQAKFAQLQQQFEKADKERVELTFQSRQLAQTNTDLALQLEELQENLQNVNADMAELSNRNLGLQTMIDNLRGSTADQIEYNLAQELEKMRISAKAREDLLKKQLEDARMQLSTEAMQRDELLQELQSLRQLTADQSDLLRRAQAIGIHADSGMSFVDHYDQSSHSISNSQLPSHMEDSVSMPKKLHELSETHYKNIESDGEDNESISWLMRSVGEFNALQSPEISSQLMNDQSSPNGLCDFLHKLNENLKSIGDTHEHVKTVHIQDAITRFLLSENTSKDDSSSDPQLALNIAQEIISMAAVINAEQASLESQERGETLRILRMTSCFEPFLNALNFFFILS